MKHVQSKKFTRNRRGQSTVEYILMVAMGALFSLQITGFFNNVLKTNFLTSGNVGKKVENNLATFFEENLCI